MVWQTALLLAAEIIHVDDVAERQHRQEALSVDQPIDDAGSVDPAARNAAWKVSVPLRTLASCRWPRGAPAPDAGHVGLGQVSSVKNSRAGSSEQAALMRFPTHALCDKPSMLASTPARTLNQKIEFGNRRFSPNESDSSGSLMGEKREQL